MTVRDAYPIPLFEDLFVQFGGARCFSKMDIRWGYNNVRICHGDEWKAAFHTNCGLFELLVIVRSRHTINYSAEYFLG